MTEKELEIFLNECYNEFEEKQQTLLEQYGISQFEEYWYDQQTSILQFKDAGRVQLEFKIIFIGTWAPQQATWLWAWGNASMMDHVQQESAKLKELAEITGFDEFIEPLLEDTDEIMAYEAAAMAVHHLKALGMYKVPGDTSHLFLALINENK